MLLTLRLILVLSSLFTVYATLDLCGKCKIDECMPPLACKNGLTNDSCNCCQVCRSEEGELCGGINSQFGICDEGLKCIKREAKSVENMYLPTGSKVGRCEPAICEAVKCGMHQTCTVVNDTAKCLCSMDCGNKLEPVCGLADGKDYRNPCKVREQECKLQVLIGYSRGYCKGCVKNGREYKFGEKASGMKKCEDCTCRHGNWACSLNLKCLREVVYQGFECTGYSNRHPPIECPDGYRCNFTEKGEDGFAERGICQRLVPDFCLVNGTRMSRNQVFVTEDCQERCVCHGPDISCVSLCPPEEVICPNDLEKKVMREKVWSKPLCHCTRGFCVEKDSCEVDGKRIADGEEYISPDCQQKCKCEAPATSCITLCPPANITCPPGHVVGYENITVDRGCSCPVPKCVLADYCTVQEKKYKIGEKFTTSDCQSLCECHGPDVHCVTLCSPNSVVCKEDEEVQTIKEKVFKESDCTCQRAVCISKATCMYEDNLYKHGDWFTDSHCLENCTCYYGKVQCITLCPLSQIMCDFNETVVYGRKVLVGATNCSCPIPTCVALSLKESSCEIDGKIVPFGDTIVTSDCSQRCSCSGQSYSCTPLCAPSQAMCNGNAKPTFAKESSKFASHCRCPVATCAHRDYVNGTCIFEGKTIKSGENFVDNNCTMNCTCEHSQVSCRSLCPPMQVTCNVAMDKMLTSHRVTERCSCPVSICVGKMQDFCEINGKQYAVGEHFISHNCMKCKCVGPEIECLPLCSPLGANRCPVGTFMETIKVAYPNTTGCFCEKPVCVGYDKCVSNGKVYKPGDVFIQPDCLSRCQCLGPDIACRSLCPPLYDKCPNDTQALQIPEDVSKTPRCSCVRTSCVGIGKCNVNGKFYKVGESFVNDECTANCTCQSSGYTCVSLCTPNDVTCGPGQRKIEVTEDVPGTRCSCKRPKCVEKGYCRFEGKTYGDGETFLDTNCQSRCVCRAPGIACVPLCSPARAICAPHQKEYFTRATIGNGSQCSCPVPGCTDDADVCMLRADSGPCYGYFVRWHFDAEAGLCNQFVYGGCRGNDNKFKSKQGCEKICKKGFVPDPYVLGDQDTRVDEPKPKRHRRVKVSGKIILAKKVGKLPAGSCLAISVEDVSRIDAPSITMASQKRDLSDVDLSAKPLYYSINFLPKHALAKYDVQASINVGWCPGKTSKEWIHEKDYLTTTSFTVPLNKKDDAYSLDVELEYYEPAQVITTSEAPTIVLPEIPEPQEEFSSDSAGQPEPVEYSNETVTIFGQIELEADVSKLPSPSCMVIAVQDVSLLDAASLLLMDDRKDVSGLEITNNTIEYKLIMKKPLEKEFYRSFSVEASISVGWCSYKEKRKSNIKNGDFITDTTFNIAFDSKTNTVEKNFHLIYYCPDENCAFSKLKNARDEGAITASAIKEQTCFSEEKSHTYPLGAEWETKDCLFCRCLENGTSCQAKPCPKLPCQLTKPVKGKCCPVCSEAPKFCLDSRGGKRKIGETWRGLDDDCERCTCMPSGKLLCAMAGCLDPVCQKGKPIKVPGLCCRVCSDKKICKEPEDGEVYVEGRIWQRKNCSLAYCSSSGLVDVPESDIVTECPYPAKMVEHCPTTCTRRTVAKVEARLKKEDSTLASTCIDNKTKERYPVGQHWHPEPCQVCVCGGDLEIRCKAVKCKPQKNCSQLIKPAGKCCPICKSADKICVHKEIKYKPGDFFVGDDKCSLCICNDGNVECSQEFCKTDQGCVYDGKRYQEGEHVKQDCNNCVCGKTGAWACTLKLCLGPTLPGSPKPTSSEDLKPTSPEGKTTKTPGCTYEGKSYAEGETRDAGDGCNTCFCAKSGGWGCTLKFCVDPPTTEQPTTSTVKSQTTPTTAVPKQGCTYEGKSYAEGETRDAGDGCNTCFCAKSGGWGCTLKFCVDPPTTEQPTTSTVKSQTTPTTAVPKQGCTYEGKSYAEGETRDAGDGCNTCFCAKSGGWGCTLKFCVDPPTTEQPTTSTVKSQTTPTTAVPKQGCTYEGKSYAEGETRDAGDGCNTCFCANNGGWGCTLKFCVNSQTTKQPDSTPEPQTTVATAPPKPGCIHDGNVFKPGTSRLADDGCNTCFCSGNTWGCTEMACVPTEEDSEEP